MSRADAIEAELQAGFPASGVAGAVAAAWRDGRESVLAIGRRQADQAEPMTADAVFWIASMTKAVTSVVALQLVAEGRIGLDEDVGAHLPELAAPRVLDGFEADGSPRLRAARAPVTLRRLLTHTSGLGYDFTSAELTRWLADNGGSLLGAGPPPGLPLLFDPGEGWAYGVGIDFAGRLIEAVTGRTLGAVFAERIFEPLGMADTGFTLNAAQRERLAPMHARLPDGGLAPMPFALPEPPFFQMGGGGLYSIAADYLRFLRALLGDGPALLPPSLAPLLTVAQVTEPRPGALKSVAAHLSADYDAFPGQPTGWTLGFLTNLEAGLAGRSAGSLSWAGLSNCYFWLDPARRVAGVLMTQVLPFADPGALGLFEVFERAVYASLD